MLYRAGKVVVASEKEMNDNDSVVYNCTRYSNCILQGNSWSFWKVVLAKFLSHDAKKIVDRYVDISMLDMQMILILNNGCYDRLISVLLFCFTSIIIIVWRISSY